jgi:hypothetical protein
MIMKGIFWLALLISANGFSQDRTGTIVLDTSHEGHTAKVRFTVSAFVPSLHKVEACSDSGPIIIDGRKPLGVGICDLPEDVIGSMILSFDNVEIDIPKELYSDCYEPQFPGTNRPTSEYLVIRIGDDLKSVFVFMNGGDAAGHYQIIWVLRTDGKHSRFSTGSCADCNFINFDSEFDERFIRYEIP